ncbi:hypothetical protein ADIS_1872 [Lunatimonas lonarensis]|uniref:Deoxyribose-phosphate aldolase n=1 Tax=Lunatimonas lonarensis TaxID=1232681 RepID=R7ZUE7_9BACT|nr:DUF6503 family protein [Lunatimonas lonarensis]EON77653.1 hypothetical protein ADIS_1872 [Lunatimonas lonarensis]
MEKTVFTAYARLWLFSAIVCLVFLSSTSCRQQTEAERILNAAIEAHGGRLFEQSMISFDFRDRSYELFKSPDAFRYVRAFTDSTGSVRDVLDNQGFVRTVNGEPVDLPDERVQAFSNSVNSVAYFAFLPYGLNDEAVFKSYLGETELEGNTYYVVKVTFSEEGGGEDFEDEFLYWVNQETNRIDYLAYLYFTDGGGLRFRKATKQHLVGGLILQDYANYKPKDKTAHLEDLESLYKERKLELLSEIELQNIRVDLVK